LYVRRTVLWVVNCPPFHFHPQTHHHVARLEEDGRSVCCAADKRGSLLPPGTAVSQVPRRREEEDLILLCTPYYFFASCCLVVVVTACAARNSPTRATAFHQPTRDKLRTTTASKSFLLFLLARVLAGPFFHQSSSTSCPETTWNRSSWVVTIRRQGTTSPTPAWVVLAVLSALVVQRQR